MKAMEEACKDPDNYKYAMADRPEMLEAMKNFYKNRFGVELETDQIMSMYGSQEGMAHIALVMRDPGDVVLVPNPGYPVFGMGPQLMGAKVETYPLYAENNFLPDFADIPEETAKAAKFMIISYPANPVCSVADDSFYEKAIAFAKKYNVSCFMTMLIPILSLAEKRENLSCLIQEPWKWVLNFILCLSLIT